MNIPDGYVVGTFISEDKNRFLCTVNIGGADETCYIASSCRLDNFIDLRGKTVLLKPVASKKATTRYSVFAVKHKRGFILLNTSLANTAISNTMHSKKLAAWGKRKNAKKEVTVDGYKTDFYISDSKTIVEIKSIISLEDTATFPTVYSERALKQLKKLEELLGGEYSARLVIISLNPQVKRVEILKDSDFYEVLLRCLERGLIIEAFTCKLANDGKVYIHKRIPFE